MAITYYMHPMKCGGSSVRRVLKELQIDYYETEELSLTEKTLSLLRDCNNDNILIFGHIQDVPLPSEKEANSADIHVNDLHIQLTKT